MHQPKRTRPPHAGAAATPTGSPQPAPPPLGELLFAELVLPQLGNHYGTLFGPNALALLGRAAFLVAARCTHQAVVMASAHDVNFLKPVPVGALLNVHARISRMGRSSMTVQVSAAIDAVPGVRSDDALRGAFEMVTVDEHGRPTPVTTPQRQGDTPGLPATAPAA